jgi:hypothetical protein
VKHDDDEPDLFGSKGARDEAIDRVMEGEGRWKALVVTRVLASLPPDWEGIGEDIRLMSAQRDIPPPHHHNCWGGFLYGCVRSGWLTKTGKHRHMKVRRSHARSSPVYRRNTTRFDPPEPLPMPQPISPTMAAEEFTF